LKVYLIHHQEIHNGMQSTILTQVKVEDSAGRYLAFARITPELLEFIRGQGFHVPDSLLNWKGKAPCSNTQPNSI